MANSPSWADCRLCPQASLPAISTVPVACRLLTVPYGEGCIMLSEHVSPQRTSGVPVPDPEWRD